MDDAGGSRTFGAFFDGPGARFFRPDGEIGDEAEQRIAALNEPVETRLAEAERIEIVLTLFRRENGDFAFDLRGNHDGDRTFLLRALFHHLRIFVAGGS